MAALGFEQLLAFWSLDNHLQIALHLQHTGYLQLGSVASVISAAAAPMDPPSPITPHDHLINSLPIVEGYLGYHFEDPILLVAALTHRSYKGFVSYEMLELQGDAVLSLAILRHTAKSHQSISTEQLHEIAAANLTNEKLARCAVNSQIAKFILLNDANLAREITEFSAAIKDEPIEFQSHGGTTKEAPKVLADVIEAIAGGIYIDTKDDLNATWKVVKNLLEPLITPSNMIEQPVQKLGKICKNIHKFVDYKHHLEGNMLTTHYIVHSILVGYGSAETRKISKLNAARDALENLSKGLEKILVTESVPNTVEDDKAKEKLRTFCAKKKFSSPPVYKLEKERGPGHKKKYLCSVCVGSTNKDYHFMLGGYRSRINQAEQAAAKYLLSELTRSKP